MRAFFVWSEAGERERERFWVLGSVWLEGKCEKVVEKSCRKSVRLKRLGTRQKRKLRGMRAACVRAEAEGDGDQIKILD